MSNREKVILFGGGGYIGLEISKFLSKKNFDVNIIDNFIYDHEKFSSGLSNFENIKIFNKNICDIKKIEDIVKSDCSIIILSGLVGDPITKKYPDLSIKYNYDAIKRLIELSNVDQVKKLIFISTCSNYGLLDNDEIADENHKLNPLSSYAKSKVDIENFILNSKILKFDYTILRFSTAFGPSERMRLDLTINQFVKSFVYNEDLIVFDENTWRPYCHVQDFAQIIFLILKSDRQLSRNQVFNAGSDENNYTKKMIIDELLNFYPNFKVKYKSMGTDLRNYRVNFNKFKKTFKFSPNYKLKNGISELINYFNDKNIKDFNLSNTNSVINLSKT